MNNACIRNILNTIPHTTNRNTDENVKNTQSCAV